MTQLVRVGPPFVRTAIPSLEVREGRYLVRFAQIPEESDAVLNPHLFVPPNPRYECKANNLTLVEAENVKMPRLFRTYLRYGAKVCSPPAIDRQFKTIDFWFSSMLQRGVSARSGCFSGREANQRDSF